MSLVLHPGRYYVESWGNLRPCQKPQEYLEHRVSELQIFSQIEEELVLNS